MIAYKDRIAAGIKASLLLVSIIGCATAVAQDTRHPQAMGLPTVQFERPSPESLQLTLDNGLVAYIAEDHRAPLVTLKAYIGVGTGHGAPGEAAALAAAFRRGPQAMSAEEFKATLNAMHAEFSVSQDHEVTEIFLDVTADKRAKAITLMGQILSAPTFEGPATGPQQRSSSASASIDYNYSLVNAVAMFEDHLYAGHAFTRDATAKQALAANQGARALHARYVVGANVTVAVAGDFKRSAAVKDTRQALKPLSANPAPAAESFTALAPAKQREVMLSQADRIQGWIVIGHELPIVPEEDEAALAVMDYILGAYHLDSRLYRSSRELRGLTNDNSSFLKPGIRGPGSYSFRTYGRPEVVRLLVDITFRELNAIRDTLPTAAELFVAKGALVDGIYADGYATGVEATQAYAREWLEQGSHERSESFPRRVSAVTAEAVRAAAQKYIHPERMIVAVLGPLDKIKAAPAIESEPQLSAWSNSSLR